MHINLYRCIHKMTITPSYFEIRDFYMKQKKWLASQNTHMVETGRAFYPPGEKSSRFSMNCRVWFESIFIRFIKMSNYGRMLWDRDLLMKYKSDYLVILHTWSKKFTYFLHQGKKVRGLFFSNFENIPFICIIHSIRAFKVVSLGEYFNLVSLDLL